MDGLRCASLTAHPDQAALPAACGAEANAQDAAPASARAESFDSPIKADK